MVKRYRHYTHEERLAYLRDYDASGQSRRRFCENIELNEWTLHSWVKARRRQTGVFGLKGTEAPQFVTLTLPKTDVVLSVSGATPDEASESIVMKRGSWSITIPRNVQKRELEQVIRALEEADAI